ncbi:MAG: Macrolide export protein MacA [Planctomycetes bacterium ADurb.Bin126]|nr:MAG: Macrolide export protein MacA [Planctomycetes bacterium ADurb.Bin126]
MSATLDLSALRQSRGGTGSGATSGPQLPDNSPSENLRPPKSRWKSRILLPGLIVLSASGLLAWSARDAFQNPMHVQVVPAVVREAADAPVAGVVAQAPGWVEPDPFPVAVPALADGVVQDVLVLEDQAVKSGQVLVRLVQDDARLALVKAEAALTQRQAELRAAQANLGAPASPSSAGSPSTRPAGARDGAALAETLRELDRQPVEVARLQAKLDELGEELAAKKRAQADGLISHVQVDLLESRVRSQRAELESQKAQESILRARLARLAVEARSDLEQSQAAVASAQAARDEARLRLDRMQIVAPGDGTVLTRSVEPGQTVMAGRSGMAPTLVRLYDPHKLQVRVDVPLASAARVAVGQRAEIVVEVLPDRTFKGRVTRVVHEADIQRNTLQFKVAIDDPSPQIKPEMLARVKFIAKPATTQPQSAQRVFAPSAVLGSEPGASVQVWIVDPARNTAIRRTVTVGSARAGDWIEAAQGLNPGDRVILSPPPDLAEGRKIEPRETTGHAAGGGH